MTELQKFLLEHPVDALEPVEVIISDRFKDAQGNMFKFKIKAMSQTEYNDYQQRCTTVKKKGKFEFDTGKYQLLVAINHTVNPDFKSAQALQESSCLNPEQFINKYLKPGEIAELARQIQKESGFNEDLEELRDEAKN